MLTYLFKTPTSRSGHRYKLQHDFNTRKAESAKILSNPRFENSLPIIVEKSENCSLPNLSKNKFITRKDITVGSLIHIIRRNSELRETEGVFLFVNDKFLPKTGDTIENLYIKHKDDDGFLYFTYCTENVFG